jgi:hypothetical protein
MFRKVGSVLILFATNLMTVGPLGAQTQHNVGSPKGVQPTLTSVITSQRLAPDAAVPFTAADAVKMDRASARRQAKGNGLSSNAKVGIGMGLGAAILVAIILASRGGSDKSSGQIMCVTTPCP